MDDTLRAESWALCDLTATPPALVTLNGGAHECKVPSTPATWKPASKVDQPGDSQTTGACGRLVLRTLRDRGTVVDLWRGRRLGVGMGDDPVTVTIARRVVPGREAEFEAWADKLTASASVFPGYLGCGRLKPGAGEGDPQNWHVVYRFASQEKLDAWEASAERQNLLQEGADLMETVAAQKVSGLETWFSLPGMLTKPPAKWKMFLVSGVVIYLLQVLEYTVFGQFVKGWPIPVRVLFMSFPVTAIMTWLVMPRASILLRRWLFGAD